MRQAIVTVLLHLARNRPSPLRKALSLGIGAAFFLCAVPLALAWLLEAVLAPASPWPRWLEALTGAASLVAGMVLLSWSVRTQWKHGGTPAPTAPPRRLITTGPYAYTRNPIQLGAMLYYLGLLSLVSSLTAGLIAFVLLLAAGCAWHGRVEEAELAARFGEDYERYRRAVPFLIPRRPDRN